MKAKLLTMVLVLTLAGSLVNAAIFSVALPELVGENQAPFNTNFLFDFNTSFNQINDVKIQIIGTYTPGQAHGDGMWNPTDQLSEVYPEIEISVFPDVGSCNTFLHALESPYDINSTFELKYGATWEFLFDGIGQGNMSIGHGVLVGWIVDSEATIDISEAYLVIDGVVPEPATFLLIGAGILCLRKKNTN